MECTVPERLEVQMQDGCQKETKAKTTIILQYTNCRESFSQLIKLFFLSFNIAQYCNISFVARTYECVRVPRGRMFFFFCIEQKLLKAFVFFFSYDGKEIFVTGSK